MLQQSVFALYPVLQGLLRALDFAAEGYQIVFCGYLLLERVLGVVHLQIKPTLHQEGEGCLENCDMHLFCSSIGRTPPYRT